ncbi:ion channel protein [Nonomuraea sp. NPDC050556]|uniref:ion channel protein n=1 Tax=Nonomuraea sp. NPDC050556 TaxID=3364369 RepID=UPI0037A9173A
MKARALLPLVLPAVLIGVGSSLVLVVVSRVAGFVQGYLWAPSDSGWWTVLVLTLVGAATGLVIWKVPGHAGPDPATESLIAPPMPVAVLPSLLLATVLSLAGGVSLGPENPITAANIALAFAIGSRFMPKVGAPAWVGLGAAGTIGALFGTPVAAALALSEMLGGDEKTPLWDKLFAPLLAAAAGSLTTVALSGEQLAVNVPAYPGFHLIDLVTGSVVATVAAGLGLLAVYAFPYAHRFFHAMRNPVVMVTVGGALLGLLGVIGGRVTLFKGLEEAGELVSGSYGSGQLILIIVVKLVALVIAGTCGFRGGRIFPVIFTGVALGLLANGLIPSIPLSLAVAGGVLGFVLAVTQQGWLSLFSAIVIVDQAVLIPIACVMILPAWLLITGKPQMLVRD